MGETKAVSQRRALGRRLTGLGVLVLFVTVLVYAIHVQGAGSWAPWGAESGGGAGSHPTASVNPTAEPTQGASEYPAPTVAPTNGQQPAPPTYEAPAEPAAGSNSAAEIIKAVAYLIGAVGGVASTLLGQIMLMRGRRQEAAAQPATSVRTPH
ncbi:hypothetical protein [Streptomyces fractus]|uniref:hypothetical protein n=1 Tax=Streptomyces fractus TaxID=641806 RepID=UPI003CF380CA